MQVTLLNFGDNERIVHLIDGMPHSIPIGQSAKVDLDEAIVKFIRRAMPTDTMIIVEDDHLITPEFRHLMETLSQVSTRDYDQLLEQVVGMIGAKNLPQIRPTRTEIRLKLRQIAFDIAQGDAPDIATAAGRKLVHDDVDPKELEQEDREQRREPPPSRHVEERPPTVPSRDEMDAALGITLGKGDTRAPGDLPDPPKQKRERATAPAPAKKAARPRARPKMAAKSASRNKNRQTDAAEKASGKSGRVRA